MENIGTKNVRIENARTENAKTENIGSGISGCVHRNEGHETKNSGTEDFTDGKKKGKKPQLLQGIVSLLVGEGCESAANRSDFKPVVSLDANNQHIK